MNQQALLKALSRLNGSVEELFGQIEPAHVDWRPRENMRSVLELANHLAQVPMVDLQVMQGVREPDVRALEGALSRSCPAELVHVWRSGVGAVSELFTQLTPLEFETVECRAFYGQPAPYGEWLLDIITHAYHHRAQLFTYLKMSGRPVDMFTLYV